jgi:fluoride exporter
MEPIVLIFFGGGLGSICRYLISKLATQSFANYYPWGTLIINLLGSFLIGLFIEKYNSHQNWRLLLVTGFCGGFTTFSAFSYENFQLIETSNYKALFSYVFTSCVGGLLATILGFWLARRG